VIEEVITPMQFIFQMTKEEFKTLLKKSLLEVVAELKLQNDSEDQLMTTQQAAAFLNLTLASVYDKTSQKLIPHYKQGKKIMFKKSELVAWIESGKISTMDDIEAETKRYFKESRFR
jgi:excisionase family DNA binding protein